MSVRAENARARPHSGAHARRIQALDVPEGLQRLKPHFEPPTRRDKCPRPRVAHARRPSSSGGVRATLEQQSVRKASKVDQKACATGAPSRAAGDALLITSLRAACDGADARKNGARVGRKGNYVSLKSDDFNTPGN